MNLRPILVANWSPTGTLQRPENGDFDKENPLRDAVFPCEALPKGQSLPTSAAAKLIRIYSSSTAWILDALGENGTALAILKACIIASRA